ncbi:DUF550 domain-containing protein [Klebsiella aerogenes]
MRTDAYYFMAKELQERRKADSEPVAWTDEEELRDANESGSGYLFGIERDANKFADPRRQIMLYRHAQPASERDQVRIAHAEWSQATFGNVGPVGPLKHLSKEALEAAEQPGDLSEWADMQFLLWDAQRRAGITDDQITQAMVDKLAVNKQREWPEPKDGEPRLHIKSQPAPVVPDSREQFEAWAKKQGLMSESFGIRSVNEQFVNSCWEAWQESRAAMLQAELVTTANKLGNSPVILDCWCRTCRPVALNDMRFVVCPDCGNKRCPRANDHRNSCTWSNEPGQEGSAYPAAPQEVRGE